MHHEATPTKHKAQQTSDRPTGNRPVGEGEPGCFYYRSTPPNAPDTRTRPEHAVITATGYGDGYTAGVDWASHITPWADVRGFAAVDNVQESGFPSDDYARGYWSGVWRTWCVIHGLGHADCLNTHNCRTVIRRAVVQAVAALAAERGEPAGESA
jgi:hypothetical protein